MSVLCADLGFEECATSITSVPDQALEGQVYSEPAKPLPDGTWTYYSFNVTEEKYQVVVNVDEDPAANCAPCQRLVICMPACMLVASQLGHCSMRPGHTTGSTRRKRSTRWLVTMTKILPPSEHVVW